jgi:hypothetical protein
VADCVKGEARDLRDGVKREVDEFRAGLDRFRRGVRDFGSRVFGSD